MPKFLTTIRALMISMICIFGFAGAAAAQTWTIDDYHYYYSLKLSHETARDNADYQREAAQSRLTNLDNEYDIGRICANHPIPGECWTDVAMEKDMVYDQLNDDILFYTTEAQFHSDQLYDVMYTLSQIENYLWP